MSYSEQDGKVVLTLSREDYDSLLIALGCAAGTASRAGWPTKGWFEMVNRINEGNPRFRPYEIAKEKPA